MNSDVGYLSGVATRVSSRSEVVTLSFLSSIKIATSPAKSKFEFDNGIKYTKKD